jgi:long-chain acyl-CoA synthetase
VLVLGKRDHVTTAETAGRLASAGRPVLRVDTRIVSREGDDASEGELHVRGENVMIGYWGDPAASADVLTDGWYRTGDVARRDDDGFFYLIDRERDLVISGGLNVYPAEVEAVLLRHRAVVEAAVIGVPDPVWGEAVKAFVVRAPGAALEEAELLAHCRAQLAGYKKPRSIEFVASLPRGSTGKVLKRELRAKYWSAEARQVH